MVREISAGAVIFRMENSTPIYLLLHYGGGHWDFVKGHIEYGENELQTVIRETDEETGITDLKFFDGFRETVRYFFHRGKQVVYKEVIFYLAETHQSDVKISFEHVGFVWLPYEEALHLLTFENAKGLLKKANRRLKQSKL